MSVVLAALLSGAAVGLLSLAVRPPEGLLKRLFRRRRPALRLVEADKRREGRRALRRRARFSARARPGQRATK